MILNGFYQDSLEQVMFAAPSLARPMFDVAIIVANANQHRIVFRISHALYDGIPLDWVWTALEVILAARNTGNFILVGSYFKRVQDRTTTKPKTTGVSIFVKLSFQALVHVPSRESHDGA
ncbi:hypothetical protein CC78DRAFT_588287 [Lojkania enalia]|uniref:Condensation domain-containing protein n=1 Tax=Lojkania enalia TaxID=147567 RepID=A0A9P4JW47_9PLEO|nr:hypothetical protein CC78DRAFT_588287 [Didymosphaeria enalia]